MKVHRATLPLTLTRAILKENAILAGLSHPMVADVLEKGKLIHLTTPQQIYEAGPLEYVKFYFPIDAVLSSGNPNARRRLHRSWNCWPRGSVGNPAVARELRHLQMRAIARFPDAPLSLAVTTSDDCSAPRTIGSATFSIDFFKRMLICWGSSPRATESIAYTSGALGGSC